MEVGVWKSEPKEVRSLSSGSMSMFNVVVVVDAVVVLLLLDRVVAIGGAAVVVVDLL